MRTASAGQLADLLETNRRESWRVRIADHTDTLQDVTSKVIAIPEITIDVNQNSRTATVVMQRETSDGSDSPLMSGTPAIYPRRRIVIDLVVKRYDESVAGSDWVEVFNGFVDVPSFGGRDGRMVLSCRDYWRVFNDTFISTEGTYGSVGGVAIETVMQQLLDDNLGSGAYTLNVVGTPSTSIYTYTQKRMKLSEALIDLANVNGWHLRFAYDQSSSSWLPTLEEPPRSKTTPDYTFTTVGYFDVPELAIDPSGIVNTVTVQYDASNAVTGSDSTSVSNWGALEIWIDATQDPQFTDSSSAQALADVIVADRANPLTVMTVTGRLFPFAEIWDLYRFPADSILYSSNQDLAVSRVVHRIPERSLRGGEAPTTTLYLQGSPSGGVDRWERLRFKTERAQQVTQITGAIEANTDTIIPTVEAKTSQASSVGTVTLVVNDPSGYVDAVSFESFNSGGDFDASTDPTTWSGYDNSAPFTLSDTVNLVEGHNSFIAWAVRYDLGAGAVWIRDVVTFDRDLVPNFTCGLHLDGTSVWLSQTGDEDFASLTYADSKVSMPSDAAADGGTVINGRTTDGTEIETGMSDGDTLYVKATGWSSTGGTGTQSNTYWRGQIGYTAPGNTPRPPTVRVQTDQNGATGTLALIISDPDGVVNATSFESTNGGGDYDFSTDPSTWTDYDNSAPYGLTDTVTISDKHISKIGWAVRYDLGEGSGDEWVQGEATFDSDVNPEINGVIVGFDDAGIPLVSLVGDEDSSGCVVGVAVGSNPTAPATGAQTTLSGAEAAGQTVLSVNSSAGFTRGNYGVLYDGSQSELVYIFSTGASTVTVNPAIVNSYASGANFDEIENTGGDLGEYGGGVRAQSGTVKLQASSVGGPEETLNVGIGEEIRVIAAAVGNAGLGPVTGIIRRRRGDTKYVKPSVEVYAARSSDDIVLTLNIEDPSLAIQANADIDWRVRDGSTQAWSAYSSTWSSTTGTAGSATTLQRTKTIAATDNDNAIGWRITYVNENGDSVELGDDVDLASATLVEKTIRVAPTAIAANSTTHNWSIGYDATYGILLQNVDTDGLTEGFYQHVPLPVGVDLTNIECRFKETASTGITCYLVGQATTLGTVTATGSGLDSASLSHTTTSQLYYLQIEWNGHNAASQVGIYWADITYESGSFRQTY